MKKILYITNIEVPYRIKFFNELAKHCELTVLCEREQSKNRNKKWNDGLNRNYDLKFLGGVKIGYESTFSLQILQYILNDYDYIIIGCYNSLVQMFAICVLRMLRKDYCLNLDGEIFVGNNGLKNKLKRFMLKGAKKYFVAGEKSKQSLKRVIDDSEVWTYYFSSLEDSELKDNSKTKHYNNPNSFVLVIGQYMEYKGLDIALQVAKVDASVQYKFIGMGNNTDGLIKLARESGVKNAVFIPFLSADELKKEYLNCEVLLLPSRQECWGLVVNEAASMGTPIVSTWGSGAAVEYLSDDYSNLLAKPNDVDSLYLSLKNLRDNTNIQEYSNYLINKSRAYSIDVSVKVFVYALELC